MLGFAGEVEIGVVLDRSVQEDQLRVPWRRRDVAGLGRRADSRQERPRVGSTSLLDEVIEVGRQDGPEPSLGDEIS